MDIEKKYDFEAYSEFLSKEVSTRSLNMIKWHIFNNGKLQLSLREMVGMDPDKILKKEGIGDKTVDEFTSAVQKLLWEYSAKTTEIMKTRDNRMQILATKVATLEMQVQMLMVYIHGRNVEGRDMMNQEVKDFIIDLVLKTVHDYEDLIGIKYEKINELLPQLNQHQISNILNRLVTSGNLEIQKGEYKFKTWEKND